MSDEETKSEVNMEDPILSPRGCSDLSRPAPVLGCSRLGQGVGGQAQALVLSVSTVLQSPVVQLYAVTATLMWTVTPRNTPSVLS